jgi:hypothetical protein
MPMPISNIKAIDCEVPVCFVLCARRHALRLVLWIFNAIKLKSSPLLPADSHAKSDSHSHLLLFTFTFTFIL